MPSPPQLAIRLERVGVTKRERVLLHDVSLAFEAAGAYSILGPSGAGKTTLLRLLNRLEEPSTGSLWFQDTPYAEMSPLSLRRRVAMVFQVPVIFSGTVRANLCLAAQLERRDAQPDPDELSGALEAAGLDGGMLERGAAALSVGEKQRVCIARALMTQPEVLLLDEPTAPLDPTAARRLIESVVRLRELTRLTVVMVSHQPEHAQSFGGQVIVLADGRVVEQTEAAQFFRAPTTQQGRSYLDRTLSGTRS